MCSIACSKLDVKISKVKIFAFFRISRLHANPKICTVLKFPTIWYYIVDVSSEHLTHSVERLFKSLPLAPSMPQNLIVESIVDELALKTSWNAPRDNGGRPVVSYTVQIREVVENGTAVDFIALMPLDIEGSQVDLTYYIRDTPSFPLTGNTEYE